MQTISREELSWIIIALNDKVKECDELMEIPDLSDGLKEIVTQQQENYFSLSNRLTKTLVDCDGRIAVK